MASRTDSEAIKTFSPEQKFGLFWEEKVCEMLNALGYNCEMIEEWEANFDLQVRDEHGNVAEYFEVKAANKSATRNRWTFDISKLWYDNLIDKDFYIVLVAVCNGIPHMFVLSANDIREHCGKPVATIEITSDPATYNGWIKKLALDI